MTVATKELTPLEIAGAAHLLELRDLVVDECAETVAGIDECLARLGVTAVHFGDGEAAR